jgi:XTP/dITP diphosphohydrolase
MELIFASHNENKVNEIRAVLPKDIHLLSLNDIGFYQEIEENGKTLEENSRIKAETIYKIYGKNVFADDTGLFVESLDGAPGVY